MDILIVVQAISILILGVLIVKAPEVSNETTE
jgi:hypothetical protein